MSTYQRRRAALALSLLAALTTITDAAMASSSHKREQYLLRHRRVQTEEPEKTGKTNDDKNTVVALSSFSIVLKGVPSDSPFGDKGMAAAVNAEGDTTNAAGDVVDGADVVDGLNEASNNSDTVEASGVEALIDAITEMGTDAFSNSEIYGEKFSSLDLGEEWTSEYTTASNVEEEADGGVVDLTDGASRPSSVVRDGIFDRRLRRAQEDETSATTTAEEGGEAAANPTTADSTPTESTSTSGTTTLTLAQDGMVTFNGLEWEATSADLTSFLVNALNSPTNKEELLEKFIRPLVCTTDQIEGDECVVEIEAVESDAGGEGEAIVAGGEDEDGAGAEEGWHITDELGNKQDVTSGPSDGVGNNAVITGGEPTATDPAETSNANGLTAESPSSDRSAEDDSNNNDLAWIIPVVVGAALLAVLVGLLLYRRRRNAARGVEESGDDGLLKPSNTDEESSAPSLQPPASWASNAYDAIVSPSFRSIVSPSKKSVKENNNAVEASDSSTAAATAGATIATATATARAAGSSRAVKSSTSNNKKKTTSDSSTAAATAGATIASSSTAAKAAAAAGLATKSNMNIDNILDDFSDGDSSLNSDSTAATSVNGGLNTSAYTLTGILDGPAPLDDRVTSLTSEDGGNGGYLPKNLKGSNGSNSGTSSRTNKQEAFEGTYRSRSAMAKLNLKKDILHVACETHDAPTTTKSMAGGDRTGDEDEGDDANLQNGNGRGVGESRTISPKKNTSLREKQRLAEKLSLLGNTNNSGNGPSSPSRSRSLGRKRKDERSSKEEMQARQQLRSIERRKLEEEEKASRDLMLPADFKRSDSKELQNDLRNGNGESRDSSEEEGYMV